jgi:uncharacterized protein YdhG (YjbR/CyaY superfamily)
MHAAYNPEVSAYINQFDAPTIERLSTLRTLVFSFAPSADESISYGMPAYKVNKRPLIYFAAFAKHIGVYATPSGHAAFAQELAAYKQGKGSVQFPHHLELPLDLIKRMIAFRYDEEVSR